MMQIRLRAFDNPELDVIDDTQNEVFRTLLVYPTKNVPPYFNDGTQVLSFSGKSNWLLA